MAEASETAKPTPEQVQAVAEAIERGDVIVCLTKCHECLNGYHYDEPTWHRWADTDDIAHALATGQPDPSNSRCGCHCARTEDRKVPRG